MHTLCAVALVGKFLFLTIFIKKKTDYLCYYIIDNIYSILVGKYLRLKWKLIATCAISPVSLFNLVLTGSSALSPEMCVSKSGCASRVTGPSPTVFRPRCRRLGSNRSGTYQQTRFYLFTTGN